MKRASLLIVLPLFGLLTGATCVPIFDLRDPDPPKGRLLAAAIIQPNVDRTAPLGAIVRVEWTAANLTSQPGVATVIVRKLDELTETIIDGGVILDTAGVTRRVDWDTAGFEAGDYAIAIRLEAGVERAADTATGTITLNDAPTFRFLAPLTDVTFGEQTPDPNEPDAEPTLEISWEASDADDAATATLNLDSDDDHANGNEIEIESITISQGVAAQVDKFEWDGTASDGSDVEEGRYFIFAVVTDGVNEDLIVTAPGRVTMPERPDEEPTELAVTAPAEDTDFLVDADPLAIEFTFPEDEDEELLIDLKVDRDDNHTNGNELTILSQRLIDEDTTTDSFDWNGADTAGAQVPSGIYRVFMVVDRGSGDPEIQEAEGLVMRRFNPVAPLISLLAPATDQTVTGGAFVRISWRDDDPEENSTIRLTIDDDEVPSEAVETNGPEIEILSGRQANPDGVQDTFSYQVPASLAPGRYTIFATVDRDGAAPFDNTATAVGKIVIEDPEDQP